MSEQFNRNGRADVPLIPMSTQPLPAMPPIGLTLVGDVIEVGMLDDDHETIGIRVQMEGSQVITISGLTADQCRHLGRLFFSMTVISIAAAESGSKS